MAMLKARAEQGCPHARKQLADMEKQAKINIKPKPEHPDLAELERRAAGGCGERVEHFFQFFFRFLSLKKFF